MPAVNSTEKAYGASGGLHGVGISCVNALSEELDVWVFRKGIVYAQTYRRGIPVGPMSNTLTGDVKATGTKVQFWPDPTIFETTQFDDKIIGTRLKELSYLNPGLAIEFIRPKGQKQLFKSKNGLLDYVDDISPDKDLQPKAIQVTGSDGGIHCFVALRWTKSAKEEIRSFCNNINTIEGGTHLTGFKTGLTRAATKFLANYVPKSLEQPSADDIREGLVAVVSVRVPQPQFEGQTKAKLGTSAAQTVTMQLVYQKLNEYFEDAKKDDLKIIADRIINATKARLAAQRARDNARKAANLATDMLPGKLTDCQSSNPAEREIFLVEGDSAGGSAKQARDRRYQAILPLKGKILNCEKASMKTILKNQEIQTIIAALGIGIGTASVDLKRLRYHKVIIMTDADVDGCLAGETKVKLLDGTYRTMEELAILYPNESTRFWVWADDGSGRHIPAVAHSARITRHVSKIYEVELDDGSVIRATGNHPFMLLTGEYTRVDELGVGTLLMRMSWRLNVKETYDRNQEENKDYNHKVASIRLVDLPEPIPVYDLTVEKYHNFLVCAGESSGVFVHNSHIRTLLLTLFFRHLPEVILNGNLYVAQAPLYRVKAGKATTWVYDDEQLAEVMAKYKTSSFNPVVSRFKGLGEMPPEILWKTTMDPANRILTQVSIDDADCDRMFQILMGDQVQPRADFIVEHSLEAAIDI